MPKFIIRDKMPCYVTWTWEVDAENESAALGVFLDGGANQSGGPEIGDALDWGSGAQETSVELAVPTLTESRHDAAHREWENYDLGDLQILEDTGGWTYNDPGRQMSRVVFFLNPHDPDGASRVGRFTVIFAGEKSSKVVACCATIGGVAVGRRGAPAEA